MSQHVLIVEDEAKIAALLRDYLEADGFECSHLDDGSEAVDWVKTNEPDFVLLDLMLPGSSGLDICREVRSFSSVPILMITAKVEEIDRLIGLELGADDYICKPFSPREVVARVKVIQRRLAARSATAEPSRHRELRVDSERFEARLGETPLDLTPLEFRLLAFLAERPGRVHNREALMGAIYSDGRVVSDRTVDTHIKNLRAKLKAASEDDYIHSVYGVGYKLD